MRHLWSPPRERERVDVDALPRLLPALLEEETGLPEGSVEAVVADTHPPVRLVYRMHEGRLWVVDRVGQAATDPRDEHDDRENPAADPPDPATARLHGDGDAWVAALGPACDYERLRITGDERLARRILDALPRTP